jgi:hypothetical protein
MYGWTPGMDQLPAVVTETSIRLLSKPPVGIFMGTSQYVGFVVIAPGWAPLALSNLTLSSAKRAPQPRIHFRSFRLHRSKPPVCTPILLRIRGDGSGGFTACVVGRRIPADPWDFPGIGCRSQIAKRTGSRNSVRRRRSSQFCALAMFRKPINTNGIRICRKAEIFSFQRKESVERCIIKRSSGQTYYATDHPLPITG